MPAAIGKSSLNMSTPTLAKALQILRFQRLNAAMIYQASTLQLPFSPDFMRVFHRPNRSNPPFITLFTTRPYPQSIVEEAFQAFASTTCCAFVPHECRPIRALPVMAFPFVTGYWLLDAHRTRVSMT